MVGSADGGPGGGGEESKGLSSRSWPQLISDSKAAASGAAATLASPPVGDGNGTEEGNKSRRMTSRSVRLTKTIKLSLA